MERTRPPGRGREGPARRDGPLEDDQVQTVAWTQSQPGPGGSQAAQRKLEREILPRLPGSEAPAGRDADRPRRQEREIERLFPALPPLPVEPKPQPGPDGKPYTLAEFQRLAAANSPTLRQAVADVEAAKGNLIQAKTYNNPTVVLHATCSCEQHEHRHGGRRVYRPAHQHGGQDQARRGRGPDEPGQRDPGPEAARMDLATAGAQRLFHPAGRRRDPDRDPGTGAVQRRDLSTSDRVCCGAREPPLTSRRP